MPAYHIQVMTWTMPLDRELVQRSIGVKQDFGVAIDSLVELVVSIDCLVNVDFVRDDERGLGAAGDDEVTELTIVGLDVALTCAEMQSLLKQLAERDENLSLSRLRVWGTRVLFPMLVAWLL